MQPQTIAGVLRDFGHFAVGGNRRCNARKAVLRHILMHETSENDGELKRNALLVNLERDTLAMARIADFLKKLRQK